MPDKVDFEISDRLLEHRRETNLKTSLTGKKKFNTSDKCNRTESENGQMGKKISNQQK